MKYFAAAITAIALAWVFWLLVQVWPNLVAQASQIRTLPLAIGLLLSLGAAYLTFAAFVTLVRILRISGLSLNELAHLYFMAQLMKHLPGRIWGIGYQWSAGRENGSLGDWVLANLGHMLLATFFALWSAWVALAFSNNGKWGLLAILGGAAVYSLSWLVVSTPLVWGWLKWLPTKVAMLGRGIFDIFAKTSTATTIWIFLLFSASSLLYYASWALYGASYPPLGANGGIQLCALYMLAWFVGYVSVITPSGLGVRELVFAWLAKDFSGDAVALMAVVGRVSLLSVDVIMGLTFSLFAPRKF